MKHHPLLFDKVRVEQEFKNKIVPFVVDKDTLAHCWKLTNLPELPRIAAAPYQHTWFELDPGKLGVMIVTTELAFLLTFFSIPRDGMIPFVTIVSRDATTYSPCGWITELGATVSVDQFSAEAQTALRVLALGDPDDPLPAYADSVGVCVFNTHREEYGDRVCFDKVQRWLKQFEGIVAATLGLLAAISHCPTTSISLAPAGRWLHKTKHGYKSLPFASHNVVRIEMTPRLIYKTLENQARTSGQRHREHEVRGHWRTLRRGRPDEFKVFVKSHKRGDPALGSIVHDAYETVRIERSIGPCP